MGEVGGREEVKGGEKEVKGESYLENAENQMQNMKNIEENSELLSCVFCSGRKFRTFDALFQHKRSKHFISSASSTVSVAEFCASFPQMLTSKSPNLVAEVTEQTSQGKDISRVHSSEISEQSSSAFSRIHSSGNRAINIHITQTFACTICGATFNSAQDLENHHSAQQPPKWYEVICEGCRRIFRDNNRALDQHKKFCTLLNNNISK